VHEDIDAYELLSDEFVIEEEPSVVFAGPSEAPPSLEPRIPEQISAAAPRSRRAPDAHGWRWMRTPLLSAAAGLAALLAMERFTGSAPAGTPTVTGRPALASPMPTSPPQPEETTANVPSDPSPPLWGDTAGLSTIRDDAVEPKTPSEAQEKKQGSQQALEKGKVALSIELGERAVELDPTDGDSWLILGAAYMQRADIKNARRCFSSCIKQATSGQRKECAAMLR
jgi:tetratricopeptide (TPR) repeat protein